MRSPLSGPVAARTWRSGEPIPAGTTAAPRRSGCSLLPYTGAGLLDDRLLDDRELDAAVALAASARLVVGNRRVRALTAREDAVVRDALRDDVRLHRVSALLRQVDVELAFAHVVGVTDDHHL